jgi:signal transduction histidine kinase
MAVGQGLDPTEIARLVVRSIARLVPAREARVALLEAEELRPLVALRDLPARHPVAASPAALARLRRAPVQRVAAEAAVEYPALRAVEGGRSVLFAPIDADELVLGFVEIHADRPFSPDEVELAAVLAGMLGTALVRARVIERARRGLDAREASAVLDQDALDHANDQLLQAAKLASIGELSAGLVHELNQPLNVLGGYVELLHEGALGEPARARALDVMQRAVARMTSLVDNLRTFVRGGAPVVEPVEVARVVLLARELTVGALKRGVQVDAEPGLVVLGDATRLGQVVVNLLANALQAGGDPVAVSVYAAAGDRVVIEVTDRGPGVPEALRGRIFEPFFTTKPAGRGTGLGLSVSARIARELGGRIEVDENPGGGARFRVSLPAWRPDGGVVS